MISAVVEFIAGLLIELLFESFGELLSELGLRYFERSRSDGSVGFVLRCVTYAVTGAILGACSFFIIPVHILNNVYMRYAWMLVSCVVTGFMLCFVTWFISRKDRHQPLWSREKFVQGVIFGISYSLSRAAMIG